MPAAARALLERLSDLLDKPLDAGGECMRSRLIMHIDVHSDQRATFARKVVAKLFEGFGCDGDGGSDGTVGGLAEFGFEPADDGHNAISGAELAQQEFAAGGLGERKLGAGVDGAEVVEILRPGGKLKQFVGLRGGQQADEPVERKFGDARLHAKVI